MKPMADGEYDVVVMGTGFTEVKCFESLFYFEELAAVYVEACVVGSG
jgi:hypothetical protein